MEAKKLEGNETEIEKVAELIVDGLMKGYPLGYIHGFTDTDMEAIYSMAYSLYENGKYDKAESLFKFLCFYDHLNPRWWIGLGANRQMQRNYEGAIKAYSYATILDIENPKPQLHAAYCFMMLEMYNEAIQALEGVIDTAGDREEHKSYKEQAVALLQVAKSKLA